MEILWQKKSLSGNQKNKKVDDENNRIWKSYFNYYIRESDLLKESPIRVGDFTPYDLDDDNPRILYDRVINPKYNYSQIWKFKYQNGEDILLYEFQEELE